MVSAPPDIEFLTRAGFSGFFSTTVVTPNHLQFFRSKTGNGYRFYFGKAGFLGENDSVLVTSSRLFLFLHKKDVKTPCGLGNYSSDDESRSNR